MSSVGHFVHQITTTDKNAQIMKELIFNATLAKKWELYVEKAMEENPCILPDYLMSFYYMGNDDVDNKEDDIPTMHKYINNSDAVDRNFKEFNQLKPTMETFEKMLVSSTKKVRKYDDINDIDYHLEEERIQGFMATFNFLTLGLFTHMGIRIPGSREEFSEKAEAVGKEFQNAFCFEPGCQPKFNNRDIPVPEWLWDEPAGKNSLINAIESGSELPWSSQACYVIPYQVKITHDGAEEKDDETPIKSILERTRNISKTQRRKDLDLFDGNLVAEEASYEEAVKAFEAIAVRCFIYGINPYYHRMIIWNWSVESFFPIGSILSSDDNMELVR
jgi:hypothetical protein